MLGNCVGDPCGKCSMCINLGTKPAGFKLKEVVKPPMGLRPKNIWLLYRIEEITEALQRQNDAGLDLNQSWVLELQEVNEMLLEEEL